MQDTVKTLVIDPRNTVAISGFSIPFRMEKLCSAFGENLGGNAPDPLWFEGYDVLAATRLLTRSTQYMPTAALLRRQSDGALRLVASDHVKVGDSYGADFLVQESQKAVLMDVFNDTSDDSNSAVFIETVSYILEEAKPFHGEGPSDILAQRRIRNDLADIRMKREIDPIIDRLEGGLDLLSCPDRRARAMSALASLRSELAIEQAD